MALVVSASQIWDLPLSVVRACMLSHFSCTWLSATPCTIAHQAPLSMEFSGHAILEWVAMPFSRGFSRPKDRTHMSYVSGTGRLLFATSSTWDAQSVSCPVVTPTPCDPMGYSWPASYVHGTLQARILEWVAIPLSGGSSQLRDQTLLHCRQILYHLSHWWGLNGITNRKT